MSPNEAWERQIVEAVQSSGLLPQGEIIKLNPPLPDFELITPNGKIGAELTEYHTSEKKRKNTEIFNERLLPRMLQRLNEVGGHGYDYLWGTIYPKEQDLFPPPKKQQEFIEEWVRAVVNNESLREARISNNNREYIEITDFSDYPYLQTVVGKIVCSWVRSVSEFRWGWFPFVGGSVGFSPQELKKILDVKKEKAKEYRQKPFKKLVLVIHSGWHIVSEFGSPQLAARLQETCREELENSGFDEVMVYSFARREGTILHNNAEIQDSACQ